MQQVADHQSGWTGDGWTHQEVAERQAPTLPTVAALRTDLMPSTIVQKITGVITILIRADEHRPEHTDAFADPGATSPTMIP